MKRLLAAILLLYLTTPLFSSGMEIVHSVSYPMQLRLEWTAVGGADYYDVYLDRVPMARVRDGHQAVIGSNDEPLESHHEYDVLIVARKAGDIELDYAAGSARTGGWEGRYQWVNRTKHTNKGKSMQLDYRVTYVDGAYRIEGLYDRWRTIFPLVSQDMIGQQIAFEGDDESQHAYRNNTQFFNTTSIKPIWWNVVSTSSTANSCVIEVRSRASGIEVVTRSTYLFHLTEEGRKELHFTTTASGVASLSLFRCPDPGSGGVFKAVMV